MGLTKEEIEILQTKLSEKETRLKEEADLLRKQRSEHEKNLRDLEEYRRRIEEDFRKGNNMNEGGAHALDDIHRENEELRRENERLHRTFNSAGQPNAACNTQASYDEYRADPPQHPKVSFREATESVPHYDGYNITLAQFIRACRRAKEIVPPSSERNLTKLLINKLRGRAYYAVEDEPCESITQLIDLLNSAFGSPKTIDQYRGELSTIYLKPQEHILDYISRVKDLRSAILDAERREVGYVGKKVEIEIDGLTTRSFCDGLPLEYRLQMNCHIQASPFEAFAMAKALAKRQELDKQRYGARERPDSGRRDELSRRPHTYPISPRPYGQNYSRNYSTDNAPRDNYTRTYQPRDRVERPQYVNRDTRNVAGNLNTNAPSPRNNQSTKWCRYCKNSGHTIEECRKRQYNNARKVESGNATGPAGQTGVTRQGPSQQTIRPVNPVEAASCTSAESQP